MSCERIEQFSSQQMYPNANIRKNFHIFIDNFDIQLFYVHLIWHLEKIEQTQIKFYLFEYESFSC